MIIELNVFMTAYPSTLEIATPDERRVVHFQTMGIDCCRTLFDEHAIDLTVKTTRLAQAGAIEWAKRELLSALDEASGGYPDLFRPNIRFHVSESISKPESTKP